MVNIEDLLEEKRTIDELSKEMGMNKKNVRKKLKTLKRNGIVESDDEYFWIVKKREGGRNYVVIVLLIGIILAGFYLRSYHIDYPVVGYHNWKSEHYLGEARNFARDGFFTHGFLIPRWDYPGLRDEPSGVHSDTLPTISVLVALVFKIFGYELWIARGVGILFSVGCIPLAYLVVKKLFSREDIALVMAFLISINPMLVFYSHNVQLVNVGLFFMLMTLYYFLLWKESNKWTHLIGCATFFTLMGLTKYPFMVVAIPMLFIFPYKRISRKTLERGLFTYVLSGMILLLIPLWMYYSSIYAMSEYANAGVAAGVSGIDLGTILKEDFWKITESYLKDSLTMLGCVFAFAGMIMFIIHAFLGMKHGSCDFYEKSDIYKFMFGSLIAIAVFMILMAGKLMGHSYYYMMIVFYILLFMAYCFTLIGYSIKRTSLELYDKESVVRSCVSPVMIIFLAVALIQPSIDSANRQFDTQFYGLDVAGEYIMSHKSAGERVMHSTHQAYGLLWHGDIMGTRGIPSNVEDIKYAENELNATWLFIYAWDFGIMQDERWGYIVSNYELMQYGFIQIEDGMQPMYLLLRRGGRLDINNDINKLLHNIKYRDYELTGGRIVRMSYVEK